MIGQYPQEVPQQEPVAVIHRLSEGYVLVIRGRTIACPSIHALGQAITKQMRVLEQEPPPQIQAAAVVPPANPTIERSSVGGSQGGRPLEPFADADAQSFYQRNNLIQAAQGLVARTINEAQFELARKQFFPDIPEDMVLSVAQSFGWASTRVQHSSAELAGLDLRGDDREELAPEEPDPDGLDQALDPDMPVQVVDLAAGREGRKAARESRRDAE